MVGDGRVIEGEDRLGGIAPVLVVALVVVGAQVNQVQGRARVGRHGVRPDRVCGAVRRGRQADTVRRDLDLAFLARQVVAEEQVLVGGGDVVVVLHPRLEVWGQSSAGFSEELIVQHAPIVAELQVVRAVRRERRVRELDGVRVELAERNAVDVDGRVLLVLVDREGNRVGARGELHVDGDVFAPVGGTLRLVEGDVLQELLLPLLAHVNHHLVVGAIRLRARVTRREGEGASLACVNGEGDGVAVLGNARGVGAARRGGITRGDGDVAAHARLVGLGLDAHAVVGSDFGVPVLLGRCVPVAGCWIVVVRVGGDHHRLLRARGAHALQVAGDLRVRLVVVPQLRVQVCG